VFETGVDQEKYKMKKVSRFFKSAAALLAAAFMLWGCELIWTPSKGSGEPEMWKVTIEPLANGAITASPIEAEEGTLITLSVQAHEGYALKAESLTARTGGGTGLTLTQSGSSTFTFLMPRENVVVDAAFEVPPPGSYTITISPAANGTISASPTEAAAGDPITLTVTPDEGYQLKAGSLKANATAVTASGTSYTFVMPAANVTITGEFEALPPDTYTITTIRTGEGTITANTASAKAGDTISLTVTPETGWRLQAGSLKVNNGAVTVSDANTFTMPAETATVTGVFEKIVYSVQITETASGTITADPKSGTVGTTITLTVTPNEGYVLKAGSVTVNAAGGSAVTVTGSGTSYTFAMPAAAVTVSAVFEAQEAPPPQQYTVTVTAPTHGTITANPVKAAAEAAITLTVTPDTTWKIQGLPKVTREGGGAVTVTGSGTAYSFAMPADNVTVSAVFEAQEAPPPQYTVTVAATPHGTISANPTTAAAGTTIALTVTPGAGYVLKAGSVKANDTPVTVTGTSGAFTMPAADVTVTGEFEAEVYPVQIGNLTNGEITASPTTAAAGTTITLTVTLETTWKLQGKPTVTGVGTVNGSGLEYTFTMPKAGVTVTAQFVPDYTAAIAGYGQTDNDTSDIDFDATDESLLLTVTEQSVVWFTASKDAAQTLTKSGADEDKVTVHTGGTVNGTTATGELAVVEVQTGDLVFDGGERNFTLNVTEPGKVSRSVAVKLNAVTNETGAALFKVKWENDTSPASAADPYPDLDKYLPDGTAALERVDTASAGEYPDFERAVRWVLANAVDNGDYLIRMEGHTSVPRLYLNAVDAENVSLRLRGTKDGPWDLKHDGGNGGIYRAAGNYTPSSTAGFINLNFASGYLKGQNKLAFILEKNVTVKGIGGTVQSSMYRSLILVDANATLVMKPGSMISEHVSTQANTPSYIPIYVNGTTSGNQYVRIEGGAITNCTFPSPGKAHLIAFKANVSNYDSGAFYKAAFPVGDWTGNTDMMVHFGGSNTDPPEAMDHPLNENELTAP
jgi:hypothetical protein